MSSTYAHYQGPSSLPSDYALLSAFNSNNDLADSESDPDSDTDSLNPARRRRRSFSNAYYYRPPRPTIGSYPRQDLSDAISNGRLAIIPSETTPLLSNPPVPRIEEPTDDCGAENGSDLLMLWEEMLILARYSLPVFGYVPFYRSRYVT